MLCLSELVFEAVDGLLMSLPLIAHSLLRPDGALTSVVEDSLVVRWPRL